MALYGQLLYQHLKLNIMGEGIKEVYMYLLGAFVVGFSVSAVIMLITHPVPSDNRDIVNVSLGTLLGMACLLYTSDAADE